MAKLISMVSNSLVIPEHVVNFLCGLSIFWMLFSPSGIKEIILGDLRRCRPAEVLKVIIDQFVKRPQDALLVDLIGWRLQLDMHGEGGVCRTQISKADLEIFDHLKSHR